MRTQMGPALGADFSSAGVHGDADVLNRSLNLRAFTTGQDIFFRQGAYNPGGSTGQEPMAQELIRVVQQNGNQLWLKLAIGQLNDQYEREVDRVARAIIQLEQHPTRKDTNEGLV